ncbi:hypothetical protein [Bradyrhizobium liaoningense]|uniref:hypothetical protein n=1 Tax=Bradyrhizobium liaoningense TaxID=43992 RepID=UPI001BA7145F|nr:hypothetical protein [Bradyrhizobium liaoningense]MBR0903347.1 hypothetical protein [Bradyrhizobium liaoningense]
MNNDGAGFFLGLVVIAAIAWVPLHFSGKSILYSRTTQLASKPNVFGAMPATVTCHYFNSTGTEDKAKYFDFGSGAENFYCPRIKDVGKWGDL